MKLINMLSLTTLLLLQGISGWCGYKPGDTVADFSLLNVDGNMVSMQSYKEAKGFIVVFTCNHCPFAKLYQQRLNDMNTTYKALGYPVLAISSNDAEAVPEDNMSEMKKRAKEKHYNFPYLYDQSQSVARAFGAVKTPQAFVIQKVNNKWVLRYYGAIDDNGAEPEKIKNKFVTDAVDALLANKSIAVTNTKSVGCAIKWKE